MYIHELCNELRNPTGSTPQLGAGSPSSKKRWRHNFCVPSLLRPAPTDDIWSTVLRTLSLGTAHFPFLGMYAMYDLSKQALRIYAIQLAIPYDLCAQFG